jgi:hypothetical protein
VFSHIQIVFEVYSQAESNRMPKDRNWLKFRRIAAISCFGLKIVLEAYNQAESNRIPKYRNWLKFRGMAAISCFRTYKLCSKGMVKHNLIECQKIEIG